MDPNVRIRRLADIKKQLGLDEERVLKHLFRRPPPKSLSVPSELNIIQPRPRSRRFKWKEDPMSSVNNAPASAPGQPRGGPGRPAPKPRRQPPMRPVAPYKPKVPMMPPTRNGSVSPGPDARYETVEFCEANGTTGRKEGNAHYDTVELVEADNPTSFKKEPDSGYEPIDLCESNNSSAARNEPDASDALANQPRTNFSGLLRRTPLPSMLGAKTEQNQPMESPPADPMRDRPRLSTPTSSGPNSPIRHDTTTGFRGRTPSSDVESYEVATIVGEAPSVEQYSEVSQRGLKPPPPPINPSQPFVTGQLDPDTEYNITTHSALNRALPPATSQDQYSYLDHSNFKRQDVSPSDLGYTEIDILPEEQPQCNNEPATDLGYTEIDVVPDFQPQIVHVAQQPGYSALTNPTREDRAGYNSKDDSFTNKATPSPQSKPPSTRIKPNLPPKPSHLRRSLDLSDTSRDSSPPSPTHSTQTTHLTPSHAAHLTPRYESSETFGTDADKEQTASAKPITCVRDPGKTPDRKDPPSRSVQSHCEVDIDAIIRRKAVKAKQEEAVVQPYYEDVDLNQIAENSSEAEPTLIRGWEEPVMPRNTKEQQEIVDVINSYSGTSPALQLEDMDSNFMFNESDDRASPLPHPAGDSWPSSSTRPHSTDSSELDDERKGDVRPPRRRAPPPPHARRNSPVPQRDMMLDRQPRQTLTLDRMPKGSGDRLNVGSEFSGRKSGSAVSPGLKARFGNFFKKKKDSSKGLNTTSFGMDPTAKSSTLPHRQSGKSANPATLLSRDDWDEDEKDSELEASMPDAFAYSVVTINDVRKSSPSQVRRRPRKGNKGFDLRKSRSLEHLSVSFERSAANKKGLSESPLVSESLDVESHIYATINKGPRVPAQRPTTPPPLSPKHLPQNSQEEEGKMVLPKSPVLSRQQKIPPPLAAKPSCRSPQGEDGKTPPARASIPPRPLPAKPTPRHPQAEENETASQEPPFVEPLDREPDDIPARNDVAGEDDKSNENVDGEQENVPAPPVKQIPVYAIVVKSSEKVDVAPKERRISQEVVISGGNEDGAFATNPSPDVPKGKRSVPPAKPVPKFTPSQSPPHPPPVLATSSKSASKYAHLITSPPPSHAAPKPPTQHVANVSQIKSISPPSHPPPVPPSGARPPKPPRSHSQDGVLPPPTSDPIYEAVDENDVSESPGPLPTLKQKYPALKPKHKPAPPPPNIKKAKSLDSPTTKGASQGQSPPHGTTSQLSPQHRDGTETAGHPLFLFSDGRVTSFIEVGQEIPVSPSMSSSTTSSAIEANDSDLSSEWDASSGEEEEDEGEKSGNRPKSKVFYIVQEILQTERTFVRGLALLHNEFRGHMMSANRAHEKQVVSEEMLRVILSNIGSLYTINTGLLAELEDRIGKWDSNPRIGDIFVKNAPYLKLYSEYISNFDHALKTLDELQKKNSLFAQVLREFESEPRCNNLPIAGYLLETVQRIPRYKLLLADYMKHLPEDSDDRANSEKALGLISAVASHINDTIRQMDNFKKIVEVSKKLIGDVGDSLISPHRRLLKEGELLKSSRKEKQPRTFFLFTDLLIYASAIPPANTTFRVIKRIPLSGMKVDILDDPEMKYGFQIISTCKSFRLDASTAEERNQWIQSFETAIKEHAQRMLSREKNRQSLMVPTPGSDAPPLGHYAPPWLPDSSVSMCQLCSIHFTVTRRRHHCRACGMIFCGECSEYEAPLAYKGSKMCRVCQTCYENLEGPVVGVESTDGGTLRNVHRRSKPLRVSKKNVSMPSVLSEVKGRDQNAVISDYLFCRLPNRSKQFKKKWFVVYNLVLYEFKRHEDVSAQRSITLPSYQVVSPVPGQDMLVFSLEHPGAGKFFFKASNEEQLDRWVEVLQKAVRGEE